MPLVAFPTLPDSSRVWVFAASAPVVGEAATQLLGSVDEFLDDWHAHGTPLSAAREWREEQFLAIGLDARDVAASGCSLDALFRRFRDFRAETGIEMLGGGRVFYRGGDGVVHATDRAGFAELAASGAVTPLTPVFDTSVTTASDWRSRFETAAGLAWHATLFPSA